MRYSATDIVDKAIDILNEYGLADLSMRRLAAALHVQPSALYWHFENKQSLLAAAADRILSQISPPDAGNLCWQDRVRLLCSEIRRVLLQYRDGAELVSTIFAFASGAQTPLSKLEQALLEAGFNIETAQAGAATILHYLYGFTVNEQQRLQAESAGAINANSSPGTDTPTDASFDFGLAVIVSGLQHLSEEGH